MAFEVHLRSSILRSCVLESRWGTSLCCIIILALTRKVSKIWRPKLLKHRRFWPPDSRLRPFGHKTPTIISINLNPWATFLPLIMCVYRLTNVRGKLRSTHHLCKRVRYCCSRSYKVVHSGSNRKRLWFFLIVINSFIWHRFWDTATCWLKIANFPYLPPSFI